MVRIGISGEIWQDNPQLQQVISAVDSGEEIELIISSYGGDLDHALAVYSILKEAKERTTARVIGVAASAATVIMMAAGKRKADNYAKFLIHAPSTFAGGNAEDLQAAADELRKYTAKLADVYAGIEGIDELLASEKWMDAQEALKIGLLTEIEENTPAIAAKRAKVLNATAGVSQKMKKQTPKNQVTMEEVQVLLAEIEQLKQEKAQLLQENELLKQQIEDLTAQLQKIQEEQANAEVENAIKEGKITAEAKEDALLMAMKDLTGFRKLMNATRVQPIIAAAGTSMKKADLLKKWKAGEITTAEYQQFIKNAI